MKTIQPFLLCWFAILPAFARAQQTTSPEALIQKMEEQHRAAIMAGDTATLFRLWAPDYVVNNSNNTVLTAAQIKSLIRKGGIDRPTFTDRIEKITFFGNTAVVMGSETAVLTGGGKPVYRRFTNVWVKEQGWLLCGRQVTSTLVQ